jgi:hypothetical protein
MEKKYYSNQFLILITKEQTDGLLGQMEIAIMESNLTTRMKIDCQ